MIIEIIFYAIGEIINQLAQFFPGYGSFPLLLPWGIDSMVSGGVNGYKILANAFPPFQVVLTAFIAYLGFRIILRLLKAVPILGKTLS